jgi:hypothetical protein
LKYFLGIEIAYSNGELFLSQRKYVLDLLKEISKLGCKPVSILIDRKYKLNSEDEEPLEDINNFQRLIGKLIYLTVMRPNISFMISQLSQFKHSSRTSHLEAINRVLRNLKKTPRKGILMKINDSNEICDYADADWARSCDKKFTTGYCTFIGGNIVT